MSHATEFNDANFESAVLGSDRPVLVDFWAAWCGPCRAVSPVIDDLAESYKESITVGKLNVDDNPDSATRFAVASIPTVVLFHEGKVAERLVGVRTADEYRAVLDRYAQVASEHNG